MSNAEKAGSTNRKPEQTLQKMLIAMGDSLNDLASSDDAEDGEDEEDNEADEVLAKLSEDEEPDWVMGTISKMVQHCMRSYQQKQIRLDKLMQPGWGYAADYFSERDMKYETAKSMVPAVVQRQTDTTAATLSPT